MPVAETIFQTVPQRDYLSLYKEGTTDYSQVLNYLHMNKDDVSKAVGIPKASIRYDNKIPREVGERINEWAVLLNLVAGYFEGDGQKTVIWFTMPNPLLGNATPRDLIRCGRYHKLLKFVMNALNENK